MNPHVRRLVVWSIGGQVGRSVIISLRAGSYTSRLLSKHLLCIYITIYTTFFYAAPKSNLFYMYLKDFFY